MKTQPDKMHAFNDLLASRDDASVSAFWGPNGPQLNYGLLTNLLSIPLDDGDNVRSGRFAAALDLWIASELSRAGFAEDGLWPRPSEPRVISPEALHGIEAICPRDEAAAPRALKAAGAQADAYVMGSVYTKQVDVGMSSWLSGPELLVSTKTMSGSFGKNLANRFEEAYGDVKNLRERYPLAAHGFFFLANASILAEPNAFDKAVHMLRQLSRSGDVYDRVSLLLLNWCSDVEQAQGEWAFRDRLRFDADIQANVPQDLSPESFFTGLIDLVLLNSPIDAHVEARELRKGSAGI